MSRDKTKLAESAVLPQVLKLREACRAGGVTGFLTCDPDQQVWLTGFRALVYSRPIVLFVGLEKSTLIVPELERAHAAEHAWVDVIEWYGERPGNAHRSHLNRLDATLASLPAGSAVAIDEQQLPLAIAEHLRAAGHELQPFGATARELSEVKLPDEIAAVRLASDVLADGVRASLAACRPGVSELEVDSAGASAILTRASALDPDTSVELLTMTPSGAERTLMPHVFSSARRMEEGDVLIHTRQLAINGYRSELERTAFVGTPSAQQARAFGVMLEAQQAAIAAIRPGAAAAAVDHAARSVMSAAGWGEAMLCRTGHGIAVGVHEHPHLRFDNPQELVPGMIVTVEPGIYVSGLGGFRHSDTVLVTDDGSELLTEFPRSLDAMTLEVRG